MSDYKEYPKKMIHPDHQDAVWKTYSGEKKSIFGDETVMISPEKFAPVTVMDLDNEKYYASRGYRPANNPNPREYEEAILESAPVDGYVFQEYPKFKYHAFNVPVIVKNKDEELALGEGWKDSPVIATEEDEVHEVELVGNHIDYSKLDKRSREYKEAKQKGLV